MAVTEMNYMEMAGGVKSGTINFGTQGETKTIQTGLSTVKQFALVQKPVWQSSQYYIFDYAVYNSDTNSAKYGASGYNGAATFGGSANLGTQIDGSNRCPVINSISGGNVSVTAPSNTNFIGDYYWYAE